MPPKKNSKKGGKKKKKKSKEAVKQNESKDDDNKKNNEKQENKEPATPPKPAKPPPLIRQISTEFKKAFNAEPRTANRDPKMKSLLKYAKFLVFGSRLNLSKLEDTTPLSAGDDNNNNNNSAGTLPPGSPLSRKDSSVGFASQKFPLAFESKNRDTVVVVDISRDMSYGQVLKTLKNHGAGKFDSIWYLEFPEDGMSDDVKYNLILCEKDWQKALSEFHFSRRSIYLKSLEFFIGAAVRGSSSKSTAAQLEAFQRCTEITAFEDLHSELPVSTLKNACNAILDSESVDLKNAASHFLWCAMSFSSRFRSYFEESGLLSSIIRNSDLFYSMGNGSGSEYILKQNIAGVLAMATYFSHGSTEQILQNDPDLRFLKVIARGGQTSAKFERVTFVLALQIALECCEVDAKRAINGFDNSDLFDVLFRESKQNDTDILWQTQLKVFALMTFSIESVIEKWDTTVFMERLSVFSKKTVELLHIDPNSKIAFECVSSIAACLWALSSTGVKIDGDGTEIIMNLLQSLESNTSTAEIIAGATGSIVYSNQALVRENPAIVDTLLRLLQNGEPGKITATTQAIQRVASFLPSTVLELEGLQIICNALADVTFELDERAQLSNVLMLLGYHTYRWAWSHENVDATVGFLQYCVSRPGSPDASYGAYTSILAMWCLGRNSKHREVLATPTTFELIVKASRLFGENYFDLQKAAIAALWTLAYDPNGRKLNDESTVLKYLVELLSSAPQMTGNVVQVIKTASRNSLKRNQSNQRRNKRRGSPKLTPLRRPKSAAPNRSTPATVDNNEKSEEQKLEDSLRETLGGINGKGGSSRKKSRRPKSAAPSRKKGASHSLMKQLSPKGNRSGGFDGRSFNQASSPSRRRKEIVPTHIIPAHDSSYVDPRCGIWQMVLSTLWIFQEEPSNVPKMRDLNVVQILLRICLSSSKTLSPEIRILAATLSQTLSRKLQSIPSKADEEAREKQREEERQRAAEKMKRMNRNKKEPPPQKSVNCHKCATANKWELDKCTACGNDLTKAKKAIVADLKAKKAAEGNTEKKEEKEEKEEKVAEDNTADEAISPADLEKQKLYIQDLECIMRPDFPEMLVITLLLISHDKVIQIYAAKSLAHLAMGKTMKALARHLGIFELLIGFCENNPYDSLSVYSMQAVLNLSTLKINQKYLGKNGFNKIMSLTTLDIPKCLTREYARQTIVNLSRHPSNRTKIYKEELRLKAMYAHGKLKPCRDPEFVKRYNSFHSPVKVQERPNSPDAEVRNRFDSWYDTLFNQKEGGDDKLNNLTMPRSRSTGGIVPLIRPESPGFKMDWALSRRTDLGNSDDNNMTVNTDLVHQLRSPLKSMFKKRGKNHSVKANTLLRPKSAPHKRRKRNRKYDSLASTSDRWAPAVHHFEKLSIDRDPMLPPTSVSPVKVVLNPAVGSNNEVIFSNNASPSQKFQSRLVKWEMVPGNRISEAINLKTYNLPSGEKVHFYENKRGLYDNDPGPEVPPKLPMTIEDIFLTNLPGNAGALDYDKSLLPEELNVLPTHPSDSKSDHISKVYRDSLENYVFFQYGNDETKKNEEEVTVNKKKVLYKKKKEWSLFELRKYENDDGSLLDGERSQNHAFEIDWERCTMKRSFWSFCCGEYPPGPFRLGDIVEAKQKRTGKWVKATVTKLRGSEGKVDVVLGDDPKNRLNRQRKMHYIHLRFPGGKAGGKGVDGNNDRNKKEITTTLSVPKRSLPDVVGYEDHLLTRIRTYSHIKKFEIIDGDSSDSSTIEFTGSENAVHLATTLVNQALNIGRAKQCMKRFFRDALTAFNFFKAAGGADIFSMQLNEFLQFAAQSKIDKHVSHGELTLLFDVVNDEITKTWVAKKEGIVFDASLNDNRALMRFEWQECLARLALLLYQKVKDKDADWVYLPEAIEYMHVNYIHKYLGTDVILHSDHFRSDRMYFDEVEKILLKNWDLIVDMFCIVGGSDLRISKKTSHPSKKRKSQRHMLVSMNEWLLFLKLIGFIDEDFTRREATFSFLWSKFTVMDDFSNPERAQMLTFFDFVEAICRVTDMKTVPSEVELAKTGALDIVSYYNLKSNGPGMRKQANIINFKKEKHNELESVTVVNEGEEVEKRTLAKKLKLMLKLFKSRLRNLKKIKKAGELEKKKKLWDEALKNKEHDIYCDLHWCSGAEIIMAGKKKKKVNVHSSSGRAPGMLVFKVNKEGDSYNRKIRDGNDVNAAELMLM